MSMPDFTIPPPFLRNVSLTIDDLADVDILCGSKSKVINAHKGNALLRQKIEASVDAYDTSSSLQDRITLNRSIIDFMRQTHGSRFLKKTSKGSWMLAEEQAVRDKVSHALRFASQQRKQRQKEQATTNSSMSIAKPIQSSTPAPPAFERQQEILQSMQKDGRATTTTTTKTNATLLEDMSSFSFTLDDVSMMDFQNDIDDNDFNDDMEPLPWNEDYNANVSMTVDDEDDDDEEDLFLAKTRQVSAVLFNMTALVSDTSFDDSPTQRRSSATAFRSILDLL